MTRRLLSVVLASAVATSAAAAYQELPFGFGRRRPPREMTVADNTEYNGKFVFVRLRYRMDGGGGFGRREPPWAHDYPRAERNFLKIVQELTLIDPHMDGSNVLTLDAPELHRFPVAYMSEPGFWTLDDAEASGLRSYLMKGGFLIFDDFRGWDLENLRDQLRRVLPESRLTLLDATHPIFHAFFEIDSLDFVQFYDRNERPEFYGVFEDNDPRKRLMIVANHNNDLGEYWEFSDTGYVPIDLSNEAYKFGVNYLVYAMTH
jgi:hypothetical protein